MTLVVDTNVVAYHLLGTEPFAAEARACLQGATALAAPAHWEAELANVVWMAVRTGVLPEAEGPARLGLARRLGVGAVATVTYAQGALLRAVRTGVSVYDTLFVELAVRSDAPLATFDEQLLRTFPDVARRPRDLVT